MNVAAVLAEDLAADGQAEARAPGSLRRHKQRENLGEGFGGDTGSVVGHRDPRDARLAVDGRRDRHRRMRPALNGVERVGDDIQHGPRDARRVEEERRQVGRRPPVDHGLGFGRPLGDGLDDVVDQRGEVAGSRIGLPFLAEREHVHHQRRDLVLIATDDVPALLKDTEVVVLQPHFHEITASADALEDVFDVVRERGDGLAGGGEPLRLHHGRVVGGVFDGERSLMADRDHQLEVVVVESPLPVFDRLDQRYGGVDVDHADGVVASAHRHADRLPHTGANHAVAAAEPVVFLGVAREHPLVPLQHVVEDRAADLHRGGITGLPVAAGLGAEFAGRGIEEHDAAAVGFHPLEDQLQDAAEQLVDVERMADRERRPVHHLEVAAGPCQPAVVRILGGGQGDRVVFPHRADDPRPVGGVGGRHDVDGRKRRRVFAVFGVDEHRPADPDPVAAGEFGPFDAGVVEVGAVGALEIADHEGVADAADFGMPAGDLVVVELDEVASLTADAHGPLGAIELEAGAAAAALDDEQRRHGVANSGSMSEATIWILSQPARAGKDASAAGVGGVKWGRPWPRRPERARDAGETEDADDAGAWMAARDRGSRRRIPRGGMVPASGLGGRIS